MVSAPVSWGASMHNRPGSGRIEVICGSMFSGKTEELIRRLRRARIAKQKVQVFKPAIDTRFAESEVTSHNGVQFEAVPVENAGQVLRALDPHTTVVGIDEAQFFDDEIVSLCEKLADEGRRVIVVGLDMDFRGEPFGPVPALMARAEQVDKIQAICVECGGPASRTQRLIDGTPAAYSDPVVLVGASEVYEARCRRCHEIRQPDTSAMGA